LFRKAAGQPYPQITSIISRFSHFRPFFSILYFDIYIQQFIYKNGDYMSVEVVMPQMGESITEGTVSKWLKAVGEKIEKDEPILEISTDKVDAEVPAPGAGVL
jgi:hypothetical protein